MLAVVFTAPFCAGRVCFAIALRTRLEPAGRRFMGDVPWWAAGVGTFFFSSIRATRRAAQAPGVCISLPATLPSRTSISQ